MTPEDYISLREGKGATVRRASGGWMVTCPAHEDQTPSLHVAEGDGGRVLLRCHAGCDVADVLRADDLALTDLFADSGRRNGRVEVAVYPYTDESGALLYEAVRFEPKAFRPRRPNGNGGRVWGLGDTRRVLYQLPQVLGAVAQGRTVYVVEGEKDVHAIERAGEVATCNPFGADAWRDEYSEALRGADVVVIADRDEKGRQHALKVMTSVQHAGATSVRVVEAAKGKDAADHLAAGRTLDELVAVGLRPVEPPSGPVTRRKLQVIDMREAMRSAGDSIDYLCEPVAPRAALTVVVAQTGLGKTWLGLVIAQAVHGGGAAGGMRCTRGTALYVDAENGPRELARRFVVLGLNPDAMVVAEANGLDLRTDAPQLRTLIKDTGASLIVLDSLRRLAPGVREDKSDDMAPLIGALAGFAREFDCAIVLLHHRSTKPGAPNMRGSSGIEDQADAVFALERVGGDPDRTRRRLRCTKFRIDREPPARWLRLDTVAGFVTLDEAEAYASPGDGAQADEPSAFESMAQRIRDLGPVVAGDGGWAPSRLATACGTTPDSRSFRGAMEALRKSGEWEATGATKNRLLRPLIPGHSGHSLGDDLNGRESSDPAPLWIKAPENAINDDLGRP